MSWHQFLQPDSSIGRASDSDSEGSGFKSLSGCQVLSVRQRWRVGLVSKTSADKPREFESLHRCQIFQGVAQLG